MFRTSLLSFILLLMLVALDLEAHEVISSNEGKPTDILCVQALQENRYFAETEAQMKRYGKRYIAGLDHTIENLRWVQALRDRLRNDKSTNPHTLHIPEFADLIDVYIAFIEEGIKSQTYGDEAYRLELLEEFKSEARHRKASESVIYRWWFNFNLRLSILATSHLRKLLTNDELEYIYKNWMKSGFHGYRCYSCDDFKKISFLLDSFPRRVMIPTIKDLGRMSINKTHGSGVHLIGLRNNVTKADGLLMYPDMFFGHDISHIRQEDIDDSLQFLSHFQQKLVDLPKYQRKLVEHVYFYLTHELQRSLIEGTDPSIIEHVQFSIVGSSHLFYLFTFIPTIRAAYGTRQLSRLISEVHQELAITDSN